MERCLLGWKDRAHVAARITRSARQTRLRIAERWPWSEQVVTAFARLAALPQPVT